MMRYNILRKIFTHNKQLLTARGSKNVAIQDEVNEVVEFLDEDDRLQREAEIERKRNKSRLLPQHRNMLLDEIPYSEPQSWIHETVKYKRMMYGKHGEKSGVNPGICWPTKEDLDDKLEYERVAYSQTIQEMIVENDKKKAEKIALIKAREIEVAKKLEKLDQWKLDLQNRIAKKEAEAQAAKDRKDRLVEEVRRHFGFKVDPRDERFKEMLEKKEKEDKKLQKESKRKAKEAKMIAKLTQKTEKEETEK